MATYESAAPVSSYAGSALLSAPADDGTRRLPVCGRTSKVIVLCEPPIDSTTISTGDLPPSMTENPIASSCRARPMATTAGLAVAPAPLDPGRPSDVPSEALQIGVTRLVQIRIVRNDRAISPPHPFLVVKLSWEYGQVQLSEDRRDRILCTLRISDLSRFPPSGHWVLQPLPPPPSITNPCPPPGSVFPIIIQIDVPLPPPSITAPSPPIASGPSWEPGWGPPPWPPGANQQPVVQPSTTTQPPKGPTSPSQPTGPTIQGHSIGGTIRVPLPSHK